MPGTQPHTQDAVAPTAAKQPVRADHDSDDAPTNEDPTTLKFTGKVAVSDEDARKKFPKGFTAKKPYLRVTPQPNK